MSFWSRQRMWPWGGGECVALQETRGPVTSAFPAWQLYIGYCHPGHEGGVDIRAPVRPALYFPSLRVGLLGRALMARTRRIARAFALPSMRLCKRCNIIKVGLGLA